MTKIGSFLAELWKYSVRVMPNPSLAAYRSMLAARRSPRRAAEYLEFAISWGKGALPHLWML